MTFKLWWRSLHKHKYACETVFANGVTQRSCLRGFFFCVRAHIRCVFIVRFSFRQIETFVRKIRLTVKCRKRSWGLGWKRIRIGLVKVKQPTRNDIFGKRRKQRRLGFGGWKIWEETQSMSKSGRIRWKGVRFRFGKDEQTTNCIATIGINLR